MGSDVYIYFREEVKTIQSNDNGIGNRVMELVHINHVVLQDDDTIYAGAMRQK